MSCNNQISPVEQDCLTINLIRGDDANILMTFFDDSSGTDIPIDLSGYDIRMEIKAVCSLGYGPFIKTIGNGLTVLSNQLNINFHKSDPIFQIFNPELTYDIAFVINNQSNHWVSGSIIITDSNTITWQ